MVYLNMMGFGDQHLLICPTVYTCIKYNQFEHFIASKCRNFKRTAHTLWSLLVQAIALTGFPSVPC